MSKVQNAKTLIKSLCEGKEVPAAEVLEVADQMGINAATLHSASSELNVVKRREGWGEDGRWIWSLPAVENVHVEKGICYRCSRPTVDVVHTVQPDGAVKSSRPDHCAACVQAEKDEKAARIAKARARLRRRIQGEGDGALNPASPEELKTFDELPWRQAKTYATGILMRPAPGNVTPDFEAERGAVKWQEPA